MSVSGSTTRTRSYGIPKISAATWASTPLEPWPISTVLDSTVRLPSPSRRTLAADVDGVTVLFSASATPAPYGLARRRRALGRAPADCRRWYRAECSAKWTSCMCSLVANVSPSLSSVAQAQLHRVDAQGAGDVVHLRLAGPVRLRRAVAAEGAGGRQVRVDGVGVDLDVGDAVRPGAAEAAVLDQPRADVGVGAAAPVAADLARGEIVPSRLHAGLDVELRRVLRDLQELLAAGQRQLDRSPRGQRQRGGQRLEVDVALGAVAAAERRRQHAHLRLGQAKDLGQVGAHRGRRLGGRPDGQAAVRLPPGQHDVGLEGAVLRRRACCRCPRRCGPPRRKPSSTSPLRSLKWLQMFVPASRFTMMSAKVWRCGGSSSCEDAARPA